MLTLLLLNGVLGVFESQVCLRPDAPLGIRETLDYTLRVCQV